MMKKMVSLVLVVIALLGWLLPGEAWAADKVVIYRDGERLEFEGWLREDTTFLPLQAVCELFDFSVNYNEPEKMFRLFDGRNYYHFYLDEDRLLHDGIEVAPVEIDGQIWLPLRYMAGLRNLDLQIDWDEQEQRIDLTYPILRVRLPEGVEVIGERQYYNLNLVEIDMEDAADSLEEIGFAAFAGTSLRRIAIPDGVEKIGVAAFESCWQLDDVKLPAELRTIEDETFNQTNLQWLLVPEKVERIGAYIFNLHQLGKTRHYTPISLVVLPPSVQQIDDLAFANCPDLLIQGLAGSYAEEYARAHGLNFAAITGEELAGYYQAAD